MIRQVRTLANDGAPATKNLAKLLRSLRETNGFKHLLKTIYGLGGTLNAFDQYGHFIRALIPRQNCFDYTSIPQSGCSANFAAPTLSAPATDDRPAQRRGTGDEPAASRRRGTGSDSLGTELEVAAGKPVEAGEPEVRAGDVRALLDFLVGEPRRQDGGKQ